MSFLTPLFLAGFAALAIPVLIHLIQRERRTVIDFPSTMFLRKVPQKIVKRRRIRHWPLLLMRLAALTLIVAAFARPYIRRSDLAAVASAGPRELVVLLDRSYSMGYEGRWDRAAAAARDAIGGLTAGDRASVVFFSTGAEVAVRSTSERGRLLSAVGAAEPGPGATRFGPALKLAGSLLAESKLPRREVVLVSDFQRGGWQGAEGVRLPDGAALTTVSVAGGETANVAITPVSLQRSTFSGQERVSVTAGVINRGPRPAQGLAIALEIDGRAVETQRLDVEAHGSRSTTFAPFTVTARHTKGTVRIGEDALARDNAFHFVIAAAEAVRVAIVERPGAARDTSLYLSRALIGESPRFEVETGDAFPAEQAQRAGVAIVNDAPVGAGAADRLARFVERGGGLLFVAGERASWPANGPDILPALPGAPVDRSTGIAGRLGGVEYGHAVFEPFRAPRSGDFSAPRFYGYRSVAPAKDAQVLARFDDGAPALLERRIGRGRTLMWTSTLDLYWNDFAVKPVFLPFIHRVARHLSGFKEQAPWLTVGQVLEPPGGAAAGAGRQPARVALTPSGRRVVLDGEEAEVLELSEQGFYEIRRQERDEDPALTVAANVDLVESNLDAMDPQEIVAAATGRAGNAPAAGAIEPPSAESQEREQRIWWYVLFAGMLLLGAESILGNRLSRAR
jgi:hypothetical protein